MEYSLQDIIDAVQYGFDYKTEAQNNGKSVPNGNVLQWLMAKKGLIYVPTEFEEFSGKPNVKTDNEYSYKGNSYQRLHDILVKNKTTREWEPHAFYTNPKGFFAREKEEFEKLFVKEESK